MSSALKWAVATSALWGALYAAALVAAPRPAPQWVELMLLLLLTGLPIGGGVVAAAKAIHDRRKGVALGQARVALGVAIALVTMGLGLLAAIHLAD